MSSPFVTGPCFVFAGVGTNRAPLFAGVCEDTPQAAIKHEFVPLVNSLGGAVIESDSAYQGSHVEALRLDLTRYNEPVRRAMATVPNVGGTPGTSVFGDLGALMLTENYSWPLWLQFPYFTKPVYAQAGMPPGYRFVACWCANDDLGNLNTKARKVSLVIRCRRIFDISNLSWTLYDSSMAGLPSID